jgi:dsRNA-specific ribonuclease
MNTSLWVFVATGVLLPLLLAEFGDWCPWLAEHIVRWSARRLEDPAVRARYEEEWLANLSEVPGKLAHLAAALGYLFSIPRMRWSLRSTVSSLYDPDHGELTSTLNLKVSSALLENALTHRSFVGENSTGPTSERLEFIGDSVLGMVVTDTLCRAYLDLPGAILAKQRAAVINMKTLANIARELHLGPYLKLGKDEEERGGRDKPAILADTLEAVIGAAYLDGGLIAASELTHRLFDPLLAQVLRASKTTVESNRTSPARQSLSQSDGSAASVDHEKCETEHHHREIH